MADRDAARELAERIMQQAHNAHDAETMIREAFAPLAEAADEAVRDEHQTGGISRSTARRLGELAAPWRNR